MSKRSHSVVLRTVANTCPDTSGGVTLGHYHSLAFSFFFFRLAGWAGIEMGRVWREMKRRAMHG